MYAELEDNFSTQVADLYMDEALNRERRKSPFGSTNGRN